MERAETDPLVGRLLSGKYRIVEQIGVGGMGRVYRADHLSLDTEVVVKVLQPKLADNKEVVERFFREAKIAARVRHPNSVHIDDFGEDDGTLYMAMEYLRGRPLDVILARERTLEPDRVIEIASQVLGVLEVAHRARIVHRDIKPENIIIEDIPGRDDFVKVVDFGIAKIIGTTTAEDDAKLTQAGTILGTPAYMAPEQVLAETIDSRSDFYALGAVCFEMLTGKPPFESERISEVLRAHLSNPPPSLRVACPDAPDSLVNAVDAALSKDPEKRPQTAEEFKNQLVGFTRRRRQTRRSSGGYVPPDEGTQCRACRNITFSEAKFCSECGAPLKAAESDRFAAVRGIIPDLIDSISEVGRSTTSTVREVVVAAFDISAVSLDGKVHTRVTQFTRVLQNRLRDIVVSNQGLFEARMAGPSIAAFGVNRSLADDPERAVRAALEARDRMQAAADEAGYRITLTGCIHAGTANIDARGAGAAFTPIEDLVELPVRIVTHGSAGRIVVSEAVRSRIDRVAKLRRLQPVRLPNRPAPVSCYELVSLGGSESSQGLAEPHLVGRDELLERCIFSDGMIELRGELGSGKSRVLAELASQLEASGRAVLSVRAAAIDDLIAAITRDLIGADAQLQPDAPPEAREILDRWTTGTFGSDLTQGQIDSSVAGAIHTLLRHRAAGPDALVIDDLHRVRGADAQLVALLACEPIADLQVIVANRAGHQPPWIHREPPASVTTIELELLEPAALASIVRDALAPTHPPKWLVDHVVANAEGSPMLAMQLLASLIDVGLIGRRAWGWNIEARPGKMPVVHGMANLLGQRVDALPPAPLRVLRAVSVALEPSGGHGSIDRALIEATVSFKAEDFADAVELLAGRHLIVATPEELELPSSIVYEVAYQRMEARERGAWHEALAAQLSHSSADETVIAAHYSKAGASDKAFEWLERACARVLAGSEPARAAALLEKTLEVARHLEGGERRVAIVSLRLGEQWLRIGELDKLHELLAEALPLARTLDHQSLIARLQRLHARTLLARSEADRAMHELDDVVSAALALQDARLYAEAHADLGEVHEARGNLESAVECLVRALELSQKSDESAVRDITLRVLNSLGRVQIRRGDHDRAKQFLEQALALAKEADDSIAAARALGNLAGVRHARGDIAGAIELTEEALARSRRCGDQMGAARQLNNLGTLGSMSGDIEGARRRFEEAYDTAQRIGWREGMAAAAAGRQRLR